MSEMPKPIDRFIDGADKLAEAIRQGPKETSDVSIPAVFEDLRSAIEERFDQIERLQRLVQLFSHFAANNDELLRVTDQLLRSRRDRI